MTYILFETDSRSEASLYSEKRVKNGEAQEEEKERESGEKV